jgi:hypothetical protein
MKSWKPLFIENSRIPVWLSYIAPIEIGAITLGFIVIARGVMNEQTKRHETIHYQQYLETGFIGFVLLYFWDYILGYARYKDGAVAYREIRAEREAYRFDHQEDYLEKRIRWQWLKGWEENDLDTEDMPIT